MDWLMPLVTGLSLGIAALLGLLLTRLMREDRRRENARVALLTELSVERRPAPQPVAEGLRPAAVPPADRLADLELRPGAAAVPDAAGGLFQPAAEPPAWPRRLAVMAAMAVMVALGALAWRALPDRPAPAVAAATPAEATPLDLLSLRHDHDGGVFIVTGLMQNPRGGAALTGVEATVLAFGDDGAMLASGRAPLDFTVVTPGDESPFVIRVPVERTVARYRVGFRTADGRVLAHVDRRQPDSTARKQAP